MIWLFTAHASTLRTSLSNPEVCRSTLISLIWNSSIYYFCIHLRKFVHGHLNLFLLTKSIWIHEIWKWNFCHSFSTDGVVLPKLARSCHLKKCKLLPFFNLKNKLLYMMQNVHLFMKELYLFYTMQISFTFKLSPGLSLFMLWPYVVKFFSLRYMQIMVYHRIICVLIIKGVYNIWKMSLNASILYTNQEIRTETKLWKFQLIRFVMKEKNLKFVRIHSDVIIFFRYLTLFIKMKACLRMYIKIQ